MSVHDAMRAKALPQESARGVCARLGLRRVRVVTFNVNGLRTVAASGIDAFLRGLDADIVCVQETRASHAQLDEALVFPTGYTAFVSSCRTRDGYSGVATFCRDELLPVAAEEGVTGALRVLDPGRNADGVGPECMTEVMRGVPPLFSEAPAAAPLPAVSSPGVSGAELSPGALPSASGAPLTIPGAPQLDAEGRCVWTDHGAFVLANVYFPNNSDSGPRHLFRTSYLRAMEARIRLLQQAGRRVIVTGDFNARACAADSWWGDDPAQVPDRLKASFRAASSGRGGGAGGGGGASTQAGELRPSRLGGDSASATSTSPRPATPAPGGGSGGGGGGGGGQRYTAFPGIAEVYGPEAAARFHAPARAAADGLDSTDCGVDAVEQIARLREAEWLAWERESEAAFKEHAWLRPSARWRRGVAAARRTVLEGGGDGPSSGVGADTSAAAAATAIATTPATASLRAFGTMRAEEEPLPDGTADTSWALGRLWLRRLQADRVAGGCALRDAFRVVAPAQRHAYTCWDTKTAARVNNCGSRIDLFLVDAALAEGPTLADCRILSDVHGSDHAPVLLELALPDAAAQLTSSAARVVGPVAANPLHCASQPCALAVCRWPCFATRRQSRITAFFGQGGGSSPLALRLSPSSLCAATATAAVAMAPATTAAAATAVTAAAPPPSSALARRQPPPKRSRSDMARSTTSSTNSQRRLVDLFISKRRRSQAAGEEGEPAAVQGGASQIQSEESNALAVEATVAPSTCTTGTGGSVSVSVSAPSQRDAQQAWKGLFKGARPPPRCKGHSLPCVQRTVVKDGPNKGRRFYVCKLPIGRKGDRNARCDHFEWAPF